MTIEEIKQHLGKPITKLSVGGFRPTYALTESWIGKVFLFGSGEELPRDDFGNEMIPLAQLYLKNLPYVPETVEGIELITLFISTEFPQPFDEMGNSWVIREYPSLEGLVRKEIVSPSSFIEPFPLRSERFELDCPLWEDGDKMLSSMRNDIIALEQSGEIESYYDIIEHYYAHKLGGYPSSSSQSGVDFGDGFEFVFQIASDPDMKLNVGDNSSFMFARNQNSNRWVMYYDHDECSGLFW
jgi:hypothetical protein